MAKLLPPLIEATIPAFYSDGTGMVSITVPFSMNRAVNQADVKGLSIKIKTVQSSSYLYSKQITDSAYFDVKSNSPNVILQIKGNTQDERDFLNRIKVGQYYKFQIAYIDTSGEIGYFSTVSVGKYTYKPERIEILNTTNGINARAYHYTGLYKNLDITEKAYSYSFNLYNLANELVYTTGELLHNSENDVNVGEQQDSFDLTMDLVIDQVYYLQYKVITMNNLTVYSKKVRIVQRETIAPEIETQVIARLCPEDGYIEVSLDGETMTSGSFMLTRACSDSNFTIWDKVQLYRLINDIPKDITPFRDFTVEQGKTYQYGLLQYNSNELYSNRIISEDKIYVDFEHAFLYDGKRQLKIKYNPKVTSLKANVLETKIDTIGGQYPFVFRNGSVYYREFPVSGLISLLSDENGLFYEGAAIADLTRENTPANAQLEAGSRTNLTAENFFNERNFKLEVLKWLTNGETKLFRSPGEGNFIVRLMNSSLSPNDQLSRMLHTFSSTAYEIADFNYDNLINYKLLMLSEPEDQVNTTMYWTTVELSTIEPEKELINSEKAVTVSFTDMTPGDKIRLVLDNEVVEIVIGATGKYIIEREVPIRAMYLLNPVTKGYCTYSYYGINASDFDIIQNISYGDVPAAQIIGPCNNVFEDLGLSIDSGDKDDDGNIIYMNNPKMSLIQLYYIKAIRREWVPVYSSNYKFYLSPFDTSIPLTNPNPILLYKEIPQMRMNQLESLDNSEFDFKLKSPNDKIALKTIADAYYDKYKVSIYKPDPDTTLLDEAEDMYRDYNQWRRPGDTEDSEESKFSEIPRKYYTLGDQKGYDPTLVIKYLDGTSEKIDLTDTIFEVYVDDNGVTHYSHSSRMLCTNKIDSIKEISLGNGVVLELGYQTKLIDYTMENNNSELRETKKTYQEKLEELMTYYSQGDPEENRDFYSDKLKAVQEAYRNIGKQVNDLL